LEIFSDDNLHKLLSTNTDTGIGDWSDMAGLIAPKSEINRLLKDISDKKLSLEEIQNRINELHANYAVYSFVWVKSILEKQVGKPIGETEVIISCIENWKKAVQTFEDMILRDAKKEFNSISKTGFGLDGNDSDKQLDFENVRGNFEENVFVIETTNKLKTDIELANKILATLNN